jgi:hypothetical protein
MVVLFDNAAVKCRSEQGGLSARRAYVCCDANSNLNAPQLRPERSLLPRVLMGN